MAQFEYVTQQDESVYSFQPLHERFLLRGQTQHVDAAQRAQVQV